MKTAILQVPASIGNLGPGFDTLGLAVSLYLRVKVRRKIDDGRGRLIARAGQRRRGEDGIARAFQLRPFAVKRPPSLEVDVISDIPERAGLGSSAAATIAGLMLRQHCDGAIPRDELLRAACHLEQHPDNAAAALFGGLTSSTVAADGRVTVSRWRWPPSWKLVIATPDVTLSTATSRRAIPRTIPLSDVVFDLQRLALLLHAVQSRDSSKMAAALADRVHQPYREALVPVLRRGLEMRHRDLLGVCLSGAGPSVVAIAARNADGVARALGRLYAAERVRCTIRVQRVHQ